MRHPTIPTMQMLRMHHTVLCLMSLGGYESPISNRFFDAYGGHGILYLSPSTSNRLIFLTITVAHLLYRSSDLKHKTTLWLLILFFIGLFFIFREGVVCKKYTNASDKYSNYTNAINTSIILPCGSRFINACRFIA